MQGEGDHKLCGGQPLESGGVCSSSINRILHPSCNQHHMPYCTRVLHSWAHTTSCFPSNRVCDWLWETMASLLAPLRDLLSLLHPISLNRPLATTHLPQLLGYVANLMWALTMLMTFQWNYPCRFHLIHEHVKIQQVYILGHLQTPKLCLIKVFVTKLGTSTSHETQTAYLSIWGYQLPFRDHPIGAFLNLTCTAKDTFCVAKFKYLRHHTT